MRIPFPTVQAELARILIKHDFTPARAELCARLFAETSLDGVYSHGLNRFPLFIEYIRKGYVKIHAVPEMAASFGALERWDGNWGPGNLNAFFCMQRAIALAQQHGMGGVALRHTNHWLRGGTYGWQAAAAGCLAICFTNTIGNMPPWGGVGCKIGNNPLVLAVPRSEGHIVLDMAMSLYSYGKMSVYRDKQELLPFDGGYDQEGNLTRDPGEILAAKCPLPIGYWKGAGLSVLLDLFAAILSDGRSVPVIGSIDDPQAEEIGLSQVFLCFDLRQQEQSAIMARVTKDVVDFIHAARPLKEGEQVYYPGERTRLTRQENLACGIPVDDALWEKVLAL